MELKDRLKSARNAAGLTQAGVAAEFAMTPQAVSQWERGEAVPEADKFPVLAQLYRVDLKWLITGEGKTPTHEAAPESRPPPPMIGERDLKVFAAAEGGPGVMIVNIDQPIDLVPRPWYLREVRDGFAVMVVGESMMPAFEPGDLAIVNPRLPILRDKDVILVSGEDGGEFRASIKRLVSYDSRSWHLRQFNPPRGQSATFTWSKQDWPRALRVVGKYYAG